MWLSWWKDWGGQLHYLWCESHNYNEGYKSGLEWTSAWWFPAPALPTAPLESKNITVAGWRAYVDGSNRKLPDADRGVEHPQKQMKLKMLMLTRHLGFTSPQPGGAVGKVPLSSAKWCGHISGRTCLILPCVILPGSPGSHIRSRRSSSTVRITKLREIKVSKRQTQLFSGPF